MKVLADKVIAVSEPAWPCRSNLAENSDLRVMTEIFQILMSPWSLLLLITWSQFWVFILVWGFFMAFFKFYKGMSVSCDKHLFSYWILYNLKRKDIKFYVLVEHWFIVTQKQHFFSSLHSHSKCLVLLNANFLYSKK